jgi:choline transporter-like protein 2/4/5
MSDSEKDHEPLAIEKKRDASWGVSEERKCTDIVFLILYIVFVLGFIAIMIVGFVLGDPYRLVYPTDYTGKTCRGDREKLKAVVYPRLEEDIYFNTVVKGEKNIFDMKFFGVCVPSCDWVETTGPHSWVCTYDQQDVDPVRATYLDGCLTDPEGAGCKDAMQHCWKQYFKMQNVFYRCVPKYDSNSIKNEKCAEPQEYKDQTREKMEADGTWDRCDVSVITFTKTTKQMPSSNQVFDKLNQAAAMWGRYFGDLRRTWMVVLVIGVIVCMIMGFVWLFIMKYCAGVMVWLTVFLAIVLSLLITFYMYFKAGLYTIEDLQSLNEKIGNSKLNESVSKWEKSDIASKLDPSDDNQEKFKYMAWATTAFTVILLLMIAALRHKINTAITIIKQASKALRSMPFLIFFPYIIVAMLIILLILWVFVSAYLASAGEITPSDMSSAMKEKMNTQFNTSSTLQFKDYKDNEVTKYLIIYVFFGMLWTNQLIQAIGMFTIAGCVSYWYWHDADEIPNSPVWASFKKAIRYHFGSLCFGSFLIAFMDFLRVCLAYVDERTKSIQGSNRAVRCIMKMVKCFLWCFTKCLKFVNKNAYIMIAMEGTSFCTSTKNAIKLILDNMAEMATINILSSFVLLLGKLFMTCVCGMLSFAYLKAEFEVTSNPESSGLSSDENQISSQWLTVLLTMIFAYFVSSAFMYVYDMAIDTILLCFCKDKDKNVKAGKNLHRQELHDLVSKRAKEHVARKSGGRRV